jgi:hypothetical protein
MLAAETINYFGMAFLFTNQGEIELDWRSAYLTDRPHVKCPLWHRLIYPTGYAEVRCVIQELDGSVIKRCYFVK